MVIARCVSTIIPVECSAGRLATTNSTPTHSMKKKLHFSANQVKSLRPLSVWPLQQVKAQCMVKPIPFLFSASVRIHYPYGLVVQYPSGLTDQMPFTWILSTTSVWLYCCTWCIMKYHCCVLSIHFLLGKPMIGHAAS